MHFDLSDEQKALRDTLVPFFDRRFGGAQGVEAIAETALDRQLWQEINDLGLGGIMVSEGHGGLAMGMLTLASVAEVLGTYAVPAPVVANALAAWVIAEAGSDSQREAWLDRLMTGNAVAAFALSEAAGPMPGDWTLAASGGEATKSAVEWAAEADLLIVGLAGGALGIVTPGSAGVTVAALDTLDRTRPLADVQFAAASIDLLPQGAAIATKLVDALLITLAADALGAAFAIHARAVDYAKERKQYGQLIGSFQALKHQLADISVEIEPARPLYWYAAHAWDMERDDAHRMAAIVKAHIGDIAVSVGRIATEAFGGIGYTWEYPGHLFLKRAMAGRSQLGTPTLHRDRAAALAGWIKAPA